MPVRLQGPTRIKRARNAIALWRVSARAHNLHTPNSLSWRRMPYHMDITTWFLFWVQLDWFVSTNAGYPLPLYVHGNIYTPIPPVSRVRKTMYRNFNRLIPPEASMCLSMVRYRLHFYHIAELNPDFRYPHDPNYVSVTHLLITAHSSKRFVLHHPDSALSCQSTSRTTTIRRQCPNAMKTSIKLYVKPVNYCHVIYSPPILLLSTDDVISGPVTSFPVPASIPCSAELLVPVPKNRPHGQPGHVGQIRLSDWSKFVILCSDWSVTKPTPFTTSGIYTRTCTR